MATSTSVPLPPGQKNFVFVWLDRCRTDYHQFRKEFCKVTFVDPIQWFFFDQTTDCSEFLVREVVAPNQAILITSGSLGRAVIQQFHESDQLDSIYIYCQDLPRYQRFADLFPKILGVFANPMELFDRLRLNFERQNSLLTLDEPRENFSPLEIPWNPWESNCPTRSLLEAGQATILIRQTATIPFKVILSNASQLIDIQCKEKYSIIVHVQKSEVTIGTLINGRVSLHDTKFDPGQVLQLIEDNEEQTYWICLSKENLTVTFGIGEMRPSFGVLHAPLDARHENLICQISYLHVVIKNVCKDFSTIADLREKIHFFLSDARLHEPSLLVLRPSTNGSRFHSGLALHHLPVRYRDLYHNLMHFKLADETFPDLLPAIEYSIRSPHGWCHQRLFEKSQLFGRNQRKTTYLRLTHDRFVIEIWPPGHSSPVHQHQQASGMFRVLHGSLLIRLFPSLNLNPGSATMSMEYLLHQDQVTWMLPRWNQTHQMKNVELDSSCLLIQSYEDERDPTKEFIHYIDNTHREIKSIELASDMLFEAFRKKIKYEWDHRSVT